MTFSPSPNLLSAQAGCSYSQPSPHREHLTGFEETSRWNPSSTLLIWLYVLSIRRSLVTESSQSIDFMHIHPIPYFIQVIKSIMQIFQIFLPSVPGQQVKRVGGPHHSVVWDSMGYLLLQSTLDQGGTDLSMGGTEQLMVDKKSGMDHFQRHELSHLGYVIITFSREQRKLKLHLFLTNCCREACLHCPERDYFCCKQNAKFLKMTSY